MSSANFCTDSNTGFHNFQQRTDTCRWCHQTRNELKNRNREVAIAELAKCRAIIDRRADYAEIIGERP